MRDETDNTPGIKPTNAATAAAGRLDDQLCFALYAATNAVSPIVDRLEAAGLVRRISDDTDGRVVHVELTGAGSDLEDSAAAVQDEVCCRTRLEPDDVIGLRTELIELANRMDEVHLPEPPGCQASVSASARSRSRNSRLTTLP